MSKKLQVTLSMAMVRKYRGSCDNCLPKSLITSHIWVIPPPIVTQIGWILNITNDDCIIHLSKKLNNIVKFYKILNLQRGFWFGSDDCLYLYKEIIS